VYIVTVITDNMNTDIFDFLKNMGSS